MSKAEQVDPPRKGRKSWEWRAFWPGNGPMPGHVAKICEKQAHPIDYSVGFDHYLLVDGNRHNFKLRNNVFQVKELLETRKGFQVFAPKRSLHFPFAADELVSLFPRLEGLQLEIVTPAGLEVVLERLGYRPSWFDVHKERFQFRWGEKVRLEVTALTAGEYACWTVCILGPELKRVVARSKKMSAKGAKVTGYIEFLRQLGGYS